MRRLLAITNVLLAVIAMCLLLIVTKLYDFTIVAPAQAQSAERTWSTSEPLPVKIVNDELPCTVQGTVDARMHLYDFGWSRVNGQNGALVVKAQE